MSPWRRLNVRVAYLLLVAALGVIAATVGPAGRAAAATDSATVQSLGSPVTNRGDLTASIESSAPVTAVTAHLITTNGTSTDVLDPVLVSSGGSATNPDGTILSNWSVATPITVSQLPLGTYAVTLDVTFQDSSTQTLQVLGQELYFLDEPQITMTADHTSTGYDYSPTVDLTGNVTILAPDGTTTPYANGTVHLIDNGGVSLPTTAVTTDASGGFAVQATATGTGWIGAGVYASGTMDGTLSGRDAIVNFTLVTDPVSLNGTHLVAATVRYGTSAVVTGTLTYLPKDSGTSYQPLRGRRVKVYNSGYPNNVAASGLTDASGQFTIKLPTWNIVGSTWKVTAGSSAGDDLFGPAQVSLPMKVRVPSVITSFHVSLNQYWKLAFSGCLNLPVRIPAAPIPNTSNLVFQYSSGGANGPWHNMRWRPPVLHSCGNGGVWFSGSTYAPRNWAYYRMYYNGKTVSGTIHLPASSAEVVAWKYADRIANFKVSTQTYSRDGKIQISGLLEYYANSAWHRYSGQTVYIIFRKTLNSPWYWIVRVKTGSTGFFSASFQDSVGPATWAAQFNGNSTHLATRSISDWLGI